MKGLLKFLVVLVVIAGAGYGGFVFWQKKQAEKAAQEAVTPPPAAPAAAAAPAATPAPAATTAPAAAYDLTVQPDGMSKAVATMTMENGDVVKLRFFTNEAPNTSKRIAELISQKFYDGIAFHRVEPGFVVQAGDPKSRTDIMGAGAGGSGVNLKAEFNSHKHEPGIWSMARMGGRTPEEDARMFDTADSQFFIMLGTTPFLDGKYTAFGKVVEGFDKVQKIKRGDKIKSFTIQ